MRIVVLGSAAGGGFPQWNCRSEYCRLARDNSPLTKPRTQSSIAVTADGTNFVLFNCSPDLRQQINETPDLHPQQKIRSTPIKSVILTNGDIDHIAGLLTMRESEPFQIYASDRVLSILKSNTVFNVLNPDYVKKDTFHLGNSFEVHDSEGNSLGLEVEAFAVPGKVALFMENESQGENFGTQEGDTVGLYVKDVKNNVGFYYIPGCAQLTDPLKKRLARSSLVLFDGTLFQDHEMVTMGIGKKTGQRMGHISMGGDEGSLASFRDMEIERKVYIHINNTNPVLMNDSPERGIVEKAGWEISFDGMVINL